MFSENIRIKHVIYLGMGGWAAAVLLMHFFLRAQFTPVPLFERLWWTAWLVFGSMLLGFVVEPLVKKSFPKPDSPTVQQHPELYLKDHEVLMGYYGVVALVVFLSAFVLSPVLYQTQLVFYVANRHFWWAVCITGMLNVGIFYFFNKAIRYGDISLVSITRGFVPVITLPISFVIYALVYPYIKLSVPSVSAWGFAGIVLVVGGLVLNVFQKKSSCKEVRHIPAGDWFATHPMLAGLLSACLAGFAINFDKVAADAANPFLLGIVVPIIVAFLTFLWTCFSSSLRRVATIFRIYGKSFLTVGFWYAMVTIVMNVAVFGHNVNYYGAVKRTSILFATVYGIAVLREGMNIRQKAVRLFVSTLIIAGVVLITLKG